MNPCQETLCCTTVTNPTESQSTTEAVIYTCQPKLINQKINFALLNAKRWSNANPQRTENQIKDSVSLQNSLKQIKHVNPLRSMITPA